MQQQTGLKEGTQNQTSHVIKNQILLFFQVDMCQAINDFFKT